MDIRDIQRRASDIVDAVDRKLNVDRDLQLNFTQLMEEIGELAREVNSKKLRGKDPDIENLEGEFADVFLQLAKLAELLDVDLGKAVDKKIEVLKKRHNL